MPNSTTLIGASSDRLPPARYQDSLEFLEYAPREPFPKQATLTRWRSEVSGLHVAIALPRQPSWALSPSTKAWLEVAAEALKACAVVVPTGPSARPTPDAASRLESMFSGWAKPDGTLPVWMPGGLWDEDQAQAAANAAGIALAQDPLQTTKPPRSPEYLRIVAMGVQRRLGEGSLMSVAECLQATDKPAFVAIQSDKPLRDAERLRALL